MNTSHIHAILTANNVQGTMCNVRHDIEDTFLSIPLLTKRLENKVIIHVARTSYQQYRSLTR